MQFQTCIRKSAHSVHHRESFATHTTPISCYSPISQKNRTPIQQAAGQDVITDISPSQFPINLLVVQGGTIANKEITIYSL